MASVLRNRAFQDRLVRVPPADEDIDKWFVGGDCAGWFYVRLLRRSISTIAIP